MRDLEKLLEAKRPFLTDGGFETWLFFQQGFEAPEFAAIVLLDDEAARRAMRSYFDGFLRMAAAVESGFVLDTNTWRGCTQWGPKLNRSEREMLKLSSVAVELAKEIRSAWQSRVSPILVNGVIGPADDGYAPGKIPSAAEAREMHRPQITTFSHSGVDMISAITMTNIGEAIGITQVANEARLPVVVSFTVETDGRLPTGDALGDAIRAVDEASENAPIYYMINCAHPDHFRDAIANGSEWVNRIGGLRETLLV